MPHDRTYPLGYKKYMTCDKIWFQKLFDLTKKVVVYWPGDADEADIIAYYDTVSDANAAAIANKTHQRYPRIQVNWWHTDMKRITCGPFDHLDATEDLPSWYDEEVMF